MYRSAAGPRPVNQSDLQAHPRLFRLVRSVSRDGCARCGCAGIFGGLPGPCSCRDRLRGIGSGYQNS